MTTIRDVAARLLTHYSDDGAAIGDGPPANLIDELRAFIPRPTAEGDQVKAAELLTMGYRPPPR
jgi:hypothetical protein